MSNSNNCIIPLTKGVWSFPSIIYKGDSSTNIAFKEKSTSGKIKAIIWEPVKEVGKFFIYIGTHCLKIFLPLTLILDTSYQATREACKGMCNLFAWLFGKSEKKVFTEEVKEEAEPLAIEEDEKLYKEIELLEVVKNIEPRQEQLTWIAFIGDPNFSKRALEQANHDYQNKRLEQIFPGLNLLYRKTTGTIEERIEVLEKIQYHLNPNTKEGMLSDKIFTKIEETIAKLCRFL